MPRNPSGRKNKSPEVRRSAEKRNPAAVSAFPYSSEELLERGLAALGFPETDGLYRTVGMRGRVSMIPLIRRYLNELELFNAVFDLVGADTGDEAGRGDLVVRHILDSLAPWKVVADLIDAFAQGSFGKKSDETAQIERLAEIADAGSGAGFPGIPLAIAFPGVGFTLIERMSRRCAFLENCAAVLGLSNVTVLNSAVEAAPAGRYDLVVFRAFRPLDHSMARTLFRLARGGVSVSHSGKLVAWKARRDKIDAEMNAIADELDGWEIIATPVPFLEHEERHVVISSSVKRLCQPS